MRALLVSFGLVAVLAAPACVRRPAPVTEPDGVVTRARASTVDAWSLQLDLHAAPFTLRWLAIPAQDPTHVALTFAAPTTSRSRSACTVAAMVDGALSPLAVSRSTSVDGEDRVQLLVTLDFVRTLSVAQRIAFRVCDEELRLGPRGAAALGELVRRFDEELAWRGPGAVQSITPVQ